MREAVIIDYTNWRGERAKRHIMPIHMWFGHNRFHGDREQWFVEAVDLDKGETRVFAMEKIHSWKQETPNEESDTRAGHRAIPRPGS